MKLPAGVLESNPSSSCHGRRRVVASGTGDGGSAKATGHIYSIGFLGGEGLPFHTAGFSLRTFSCLDCCGIYKSLLPRVACFLSFHVISPLSHFENSKKERIICMLRIIPHFLSNVPPKSCLQ